MQGADGAADLEHILALLLEDAGAHLEILAAEEVGDGECFGFGRSGRDGNLLAWLRASLTLGSLLGLLLLHHLLPLLLLHHGLLLDALDVLRDRETGLLSLRCYLLLHLADLLWCGLLAGLELGHARRGLGCRHGCGRYGRGGGGRMSKE